MPESGTAKASTTTKKAKLGGSKKGSHPTQSKVVEKLTAAQSSLRTGSKSPVPPNGKPIAEASRKSKSPHPPNAVAPTPVAEPAVEPVKELAAAPIPAPAAAFEKTPDLANVYQQLVVDDTILQAVNPISPVATEQTPRKVTTVEDIFPDMTWEDEITDLLATGSPALAPLPPVPVILESEAPQTAVFDAAVTAARAKKEKSPRRQKAKSPVPKSIATTVAVKDAAAAQPPAAEALHEPILSLSPDACPPLVASNLPTETLKSEVVQQAAAVVPVDAAADIFVSTPADSPPPSSPQQAAMSENVSSATVPSAGSQSKSKRKKNKSRSEDDTMIKSVSPPAVSAPAALQPAPVNPQNTLVSDIKQIREQISQTLGASSVTGDSTDSSKVGALEAENKALKKTVDELVARISKLETRVSGLEKPVALKSGTKSPAAASNGKSAKAAAVDDDDDIDLFGSDDDDDGAADALREKRLAEYAAKKSKKPGPIAKSSVVLDVKPWDDETDMKALEQAVRSIQMDGLVWGASKLAPVAFNIKKLSIVCVVEDDKVSIEELTEKIEQFEDFVQSVDIAGFNKI